MVPSPEQSDDTPMGLLLIKDTVISLDITARENTTKVAQEADISMSTLERNYGTFLDKAIQKKVQGEVRTESGEKQKA
jgi:hypothetical protein